ncbi:MAG TPA: di-heme oxidoredictase family protein [Myxococcota bacterium]|nr:di-heme oxidoredictase family protein [Myxococcota bacterium]
MIRTDRRASVTTIALGCGVLLTAGAQAQQVRDHFRTSGSVQAEDSTPSARPGTQAETLAPAPSAPAEAPAAFDNQTNGYLPQGPPFDEIEEDTVEPLRSFNDNRFIFEEAETIEDGLGPTYNAQGCRECHQNVVTGGASQIAEHRTGRLRNGEFFESLGGSLVHSRAIHADIVERVAFQDTIRTLRISTNTLGAGFVEAISNSTLLALRSRQPFWMRGTAVEVPVLEAEGRLRIGRFGWKSQHASLQSFSADAYLNEMGITTPTLPDENTASGVYVGMGSEYDHVPDPEDDGIDVIAFADFMRATKAPPRGPQTNATRAGEALFDELGCAVCHTPAIVTASAGTVINGGAFVVPAALGNKTIHPYSDFLMHDIGSGDGIPVLPGAAYAGTASQIRTAPLWGLRTRSRLMHDGLSFTKQDAIARHGGQAAGVRARFQRLSAGEQAQLLAFLDSL